MAFFLSPYLFLLCAKGLLCLILNAVVDGLIEVYKVCFMVPSFSHLLFADDNIIFYTANIKQALHVKNLLMLYEVSLG